MGGTNRERADVGMLELVVVVWLRCITGEVRLHPQHTQSHNYLLLHVLHAIRYKLPPRVWLPQQGALES